MRAQGCARSAGPRSRRAACAGCPCPGRCGDHPWCNTALSADARAGLLLQALTPDEKIGLLAGDDLTGVCACYPASHTGTENGVSRLDVPPVHFSDGPVGPRQGQTTAMPIPMALAATFDRRLAVAHGAVIGDEARHKGNDAVFGPQVYVAQPPDAGEPPRQLRAFAKLRLERGTARRVDFTLGRRAFAHWDAGWKVTPGCYRVLAGTSSRTLPLRRQTALGGRACY